VSRPGHLPRRAAGAGRGEGLPRTPRGSAEHELEEALAEEDFDAGEVGVLQGEEDAVGTEEAERRDGVDV
jgi:hypothetical protein